MPATTRSGLEIRYTVQGSGPPVLLGHSFLCSGAMWEPQVGPLSERFTVINVDARGHGESASAPPGTTLEDMLRDMLAVLDEEGIDRAVWAGLSMGGMVAMRAALETPDRVRALILMDTDAGSEDVWIRLRYAMLARVAGTMGIRPVLSRVLPLMFGRTSLAGRRALVDEWRARFAAVDVPSVRNMVGAIAGREDLLDRLGGIAVPTLVIVGAEDETLPPERAARLASAIPGAEYLEVEGAGHLSALERPDIVTPAMLRFLEALPRD